MESISLQNIQQGFPTDSQDQVSHEVTLGKFNSTIFDTDPDSAPEDIYQDEFLHELKTDKFVKIDDGIGMMVNKGDNEIIFRKNGSSTDKCVGEYVMKLEDGELEQVTLNLMAVKEAIYTDISLKSNGVEVRVTKNAKEQFVVTIFSGGALVITMMSSTSLLIRKMIYVLLYGIMN